MPNSYLFFGCFDGYNCFKQIKEVLLMNNMCIHDSTVLAAVLRASLKCGINSEKGLEFMSFIYGVLDIPGDTGFEEFLEIIQDESTNNKFIEATADYDDYEKLVDFLYALFDIDGEAGERLDNRDDNRDMDSAVELSGAGLESIVFDDDLKKMLEFEDLDETITVEGNMENYNDSGEERLNILGCEIKEMKLPDRQYVNYIEIPDQPFEILQNDFKTATHLKFLEEVADRMQESDKTRIMFIVKSKQTGLLACSYLSALLDPDKYINYSDEEDEKGDDENDVAGDNEHEVDFSGKIPIINAPELRSKQAMNIFGRMAYSDGGMGVQQAVVGRGVFIPWYEKYSSGCPLIVMIDESQFLPFDLQDNIKYLGEMFDDIFIICCATDKENDDLDISDISGLGTASLASILEAAKNISFEALYDTYSIEEPDITSEYYKKVLVDAAAAEGCTIDQNVNVEEVLKNLKKFRAHSWNGNLSILRLIKKVLSDAHDINGKKILNEKNFEFLKSNTFIINKQEKKQPEQKGTAVEKMNREIYGLEHVKKTILETVCVLKSSYERQKAGLKPMQINNTFVFLGPPGVGKTKMAEHLTSILFENNLLPDRRFISINAAQLKGMFVGHTAPKVTAIFENYDAIFLDEAYSLASRNTDKSLDSFSQEALAQLCVELEKHSRDKLVIFAGYGGDVDGENNKMKEFLNANPGIASRITFTVEFPSYSPDIEMPEIFNRIATNEDYDLEDGWREIAVDFFRERAKSDSFGNGREARRLFQNAVVVQASRIFGKKADIAAMRLITCEDLKTAAEKLLTGEKHIAGRKEEKRRIGFCFNEY